MAEKETVTNTDRQAQAGRGRTSFFLAGARSQLQKAPARCKTTCTFLHTFPPSSPATKQVGHVLLLGQCPTLTRPRVVLAIKVSTAHMRCHLSQDGQELADGHQEPTWSPGPALDRTGRGLTVCSILGRANDATARHADKTHPKSKWTDGVNTMHG